MNSDLRDDKQFFVDHPGAVPITAAQVKTSSEFKSVDQQKLSFLYGILNIIIRRERS